MFLESVAQRVILALMAVFLVVTTGKDWYDFYTCRKYTGGTAEEIEVPLDTILLFVKDGSIIPVTEPALSTEEQTGDIEYRRFGNVTAPYEMYTDAGDGYAYERGEYIIKDIR